MFPNITIGALVDPAYSPVDEGSLGVHEVELVVEGGPGLGDGRGVGQAANCSLHLKRIFYHRLIRRVI